MLIELQREQEKQKEKEDLLAELRSGRGGKKHREAADAMPTVHYQPNATMPLDWEDEESSEPVRYTHAPRDLLVADRGDPYARRRSRSTDARAPNFNVQIRQSCIIDEYWSPSRGRRSNENVVDPLDDIR